MVTTKGMSPRRDKKLAITTPVRILGIRQSTKNIQKMITKTIVLKFNFWLKNLKNSK